MATFTLTITYPDADQPRVVAALKAYYNVTLTADAVEAFRRDVAAYARSIVKSQEKVAADNPPTVAFT